MDRSFLEFCLSMPMAPVTVLMSLVAIYWLLVILGAVGLDLLDVDLEIELGTESNPDASLVDWGLIGLRWFNLGDVPLMVWLSALALVSWTVTAIFDRDVVAPAAMESTGILLRNLAVGVLGAKMLTQPLKGRLMHREPNPAQEMIGRRGVVTTNEFTDRFGQIECPTDNGAPLLLSARPLAGSLLKGTAVEIVDYIAESRTYVVREADQQRD